MDVSSVPGYSDVVKQPMDFGTMEIKVNKGRYRSLDEFLVSVPVLLVYSYIAYDISRPTSS